MKSFPNILNTVLACILVVLMIFVGLPGTGAQAAGTVTATPTTQPSTAPDNHPACDPARTIQVSGSAVVNVTPDRVSIRLGLQSNGHSAREVQNDNAATVKRITRAITTLGVESKDIATDWYVIQPIYRDYDSLNIKGYRIDNLMTVTLRDVTKVNDVLAAALDAGANQVVDVQFYSSELRKYRDQAREMAMKAAREKAQALARTAGSDIGCVMNIAENSWSYYNGWGWWSGGSSGSRWSANATQNVQDAQPAGAVDPLEDGGAVSAGQISIRAEVSASFGLK
jgi:uncharacterized protein YggE